MGRVERRSAAILYPTAKGNRQRLLPVKYYLLAIALVLAVSAEARMYQWVNPNSGTVQLSGAPPSWYRNDEGGPRVLVFDGGHLIDDTAIEVSDDERQALRGDAFQALGDRTNLEALEQLERIARRQDDMSDTAQEWDEEDDIVEPTAEQEPGVLDQETIEELKAIIAKWDQRNDAGTNEESNEATAENSAEDDIVFYCRALANTYGRSSRFERDCRRQESNARKTLARMSVPPDLEQTCREFARLEGGSYQAMYDCVRAESRVRGILKPGGDGRVPVL